VVAQYEYLVILSPNEYPLYVTLFRTEWLLHVPHVVTLKTVCFVHGVNLCVFM